MKQFIILALTFFISFTAMAQEKVNHRDLLELKSRMEGFFTSELQSKTDTNYYNLHLHMEPIWERSEDGYWLYVEQSIASDVNKSYHQRIYHLYRQDDITLVSKAFELNAPLRFVGAYNNTDLLKGLTKDSLVDKQGCAIYLHKNAEGNFLGSTSSNECLNSFQGATYTTSHLTIYENKLVTWDRGWDNDGKQVWGFKNDGYQFIKQ